MQKPPCSSISHILDALLLVTFSSNKDHGLQRELPTTGKNITNEILRSRGGFSSG
jgi:hypothetical protein